MKRYVGRRTDDGCIVTVEESGQERPLDLRHDLRNHSPCGPEWGYGGSGPAQLALGLCADVLGDDEQAQEVYQKVKFSLVGGLPREGFDITEEEVRRHISRVWEE